MATTGGCPSDVYSHGSASWRLSFRCVQPWLYILEAVHQMYTALVLHPGGCPSDVYSPGCASWRLCTALVLHLMFLMEGCGRWASK